MREQTPVERFLLQPGTSRLERGIGLTAVVIGVVLAFIVCVFAIKLLLDGQVVTTPVLYVGIAVATLSWFFLVAGVRLLLSRPNKHGSLFAPWVWFAVSGLMLFLAGLFAVRSWAQPSLADGRAIVSALLLALLAFGAGSYFRRKQGKGRNAA